MLFLIVDVVEFMVFLVSFGLFRLVQLQCLVDLCYEYIFGSWVLQ